MVLIAAAAVTTTLSCYVMMRRKDHGSSPRRRRRAPSHGLTRFLTTGMIPPKRVSHGFHYEPIINIALWYDTRLPKEEILQRAFADHVVPHMRFHSVPHQTTDCGPVDWVCKRVEVEKHFFTRTAQMRPTLEAEGFAATAEGAVRREVEELLNTTLATKAEGRPWWEVHFVEAPPVPGHVAGSRPPGMVVVRVHHSLGDGVSLMEMFADVVVDADGTPISQMKLFAPSSRGARTSLNPLKVVRFAASAIKSFFQILGLATVGGDTECAFQNSSRQLPFQPNRFTVYFPSHSLALVKKIKDSLTSQSGKSITVNDVEFALFSGAIRRFLLRHGTTNVSDRSFRLSALNLFALPFATSLDFRYQDQLRNIWALLYSPVAVSQQTALERLRDVNDFFTAVKEADNAVVPMTFLIQRILWHLPAWLGMTLSTSALERCAFVFSNVPGPQCPVFFGGERIRHAHVVFPNLSNHVGIVSAQGVLHMAMVLSSNSQEERSVMRRELPQDFIAELDELVKAAGVDAGQQIAAML
jgi:diacylglycerol O-acyltransferase / wax synthase